ncbi:hypothetical protein [Halomonas binhaiensis]|uniref:Uncharacterized protein n=1 Tax=Halomonas binhaiensis TaxID=2562282 RepID=A0A5C1NG13_9GAMM|nr:hypothetical protein [Halomonas binhaiensis]QEM81177.1 hypothetical protein E4T21_06215 [Halomonas binhaiensis]
MRYSRAMTFNVALPLAAFVILGGAIFGGQAYSESRLSGDIQRALATELKTPEPMVEVKYLQKVNHGYGVCGLYKTPSSPQGYASFFYDKVNDRVTLDVNSTRYTANCGLSALC